MKIMKEININMVVKMAMLSRKLFQKRPANVYVASATQRICRNALSKSKQFNDNGLWHVAQLSVS
jgi:hypothetical protein